MRSERYAPPLPLLFLNNQSPPTRSPISKQVNGKPRRLSAAQAMIPDAPAPITHVWLWGRCRRAGVTALTS